MKYAILFLMSASAHAYTAQLTTQPNTTFGQPQTTNYGIYQPSQPGQGTAIQNQQTGQVQRCYVVGSRVVCQ